MPSLLVSKRVWKSILVLFAGPVQALIVFLNKNVQRGVSAFDSRLIAVDPVTGLGAGQNDAHVVAFKGRCYLWNRGGLDRIDQGTAGSKGDTVLDVACFLELCDFGLA